MGRINVLDKFTAEKIAAGEVVERPASVIKELVENSIDAGATSVTVEIKAGGTQYMRVTDNGSGMEFDDARAAFLRHATSKIKAAEDLEKIKSLGFRGEALCSIAAVSRCELFTKRKEEAEGTNVIMEGGEEIKAESTGCPDGTTIIVKNLFYNTPARMKFLKKDASEAAMVVDVCNKQALSHPSVSVRVIKDGKDALFTPGDNKLQSAVHSVLGREIASSMATVDYEKNGIKVTGLTGKNNLSRPNRLMQICFINGRYVVNKTVFTALSEAYKNELMTGRFPIAVLNIEIDASLVDVNVHPSKTEVKFADERAVYETVYWGVKNALTGTASVRDILEKKDTHSAYKMPFAAKKSEQIIFSAQKKDVPKKFTPYVPTVAAEKKAIPTVDEIRETVKPFADKLPVRPIEGIENVKEKRSEITEKKMEEPFMAEEIIKESPKEEKPILNNEKKASVLPELEYVHIIGQLFSTYILIEYEDSFLLLDQHAAHERIKYEEIKERGNKAPSQLLLMPISLSLTPVEKETALSEGEFLNGLGFEYEEFGEKAVVIRALPADCPYDDGGNLFIELLALLMGSGSGETMYKRDKAVYTVACKMAIKANNRLTVAEMEEIYRRTAQLEGITTCPHGRPITVKLSKYQVEKMFKRV